MSYLTVESEVASLKKVCLHRPGAELLNLQPQDLNRLLFDDIPYLEAAQREHDAFAQDLRNCGVEVLYLEELVAQALDTAPDIRAAFIEEWIRESGLRGTIAPSAVRTYLQAISNNLDLVRQSMAGITARELDIPQGATSRLRSFVASERGATPALVVDPMPDLYFTRDPFVVIGNRVLINHMYSQTRNRETIYARYIFTHHPIYGGVKRVMEPDSAFHMEGGDILVLNNHVLAVGISQRTEAGAVDALANALFWQEDSTFDTICAISIPQERSYMHLDTVFTQLDVDMFTIHPTIYHALEVFKMTKGAHKHEVTIERLDMKFQKALAAILNLDSVQLIPCGGGDTIAANREQWDDGCNTLCISPKKVCVYARNIQTNHALLQAGVSVVELNASELTRGRGGPRCMSMPFERACL